MKMARLDSIFWILPDFYLYTNMHTVSLTLKCVAHIQHLGVMAPQKNHPAEAGLEIKQAWLTEAGSPGDRSHLAEVLFAFSDVHQAQRTRWDFLEPERFSYLPPAHVWGTNTPWNLLALYQIWHFIGLSVQKRCLNFQEWFFRLD